MANIQKTIKEGIKAVTPLSVKSLVRRIRARKYKNMQPQEAFSLIYETGGWGKSSDPSQPFYSGSGTHNDQAVAAYIQSVQEFVGALGYKPNIVDLGCGDFHVGSQIRPLCGGYIACDVVPKLIAFNKEKFRSLDVDFRALDFTRDELPKGDIVFIREVLQHLSNEHISRALPKICATYKYLVLTEHLPRLARFRHNLDKPVGPTVRRERHSGVVLTSPPFNLKPKSQKELCRCKGNEGVIVTTLYEL